MIIQKHRFHSLSNYLRALKCHHLRKSIENDFHLNLSYFRLIILQNHCCIPNHYPNDLNARPSLK